LKPQALLPAGLMHYQIRAASFDEEKDFIVYVLVHGFMIFLMLETPSGDSQPFQ